MLRALASRWLLYADVWPADTSGKRLDSAWLSRADAEHKTAEALKELDFVLFFFVFSFPLYYFSHWLNTDPAVGANQKKMSSLY